MKYLMSANWKMHKTAEEAADFFKAFGEKIAKKPADREVLIFAPFTTLEAAARAHSSNPCFELGAQNCYPADHGAFTGEISPSMLKASGCAWVLAGHSERRSIFKESEAFVGEKAAFALNAGLKVMLCVGESLEERDSGKLNAVLEKQMREGLANVAESFAPDSIALAYEPVWAIGTGRVAGKEEILEAHAIVRKFLEERYPSRGKEICILYGGSVKPENCAEIIGLDNVNGVLVGGASLKAGDFADIVLA